MLAPMLAARAACQGWLFTAAQAREAGYPLAEQRQILRRGDWVRLRRGIFSERERWDLIEADPVARHTAACRAALMAMTGGGWVSHSSAAALLGVPMLNALPSDVHLTRPGSGRHPAPGVRMHFAPVPPGHQQVRAGLALTSLTRTMFDLSRTASLDSAVVGLDHVLHHQMATRRDLQNVVDECARWPGHARAVRALSLADALAESPGETLSRMRIAESGLPQPELQVVLSLSGLIVRVDFYWRDLRVVGEFDGAIKYSTRRDLVREKQRDDRLREHGYVPARWGWADVVGDSAVMIERIRRAMQTADRMRLAS